MGNNIYKWSSALKNVVVYNPKLSQCIHLFIISYLFIDIVCYGKQFLWMQMVPNGNILRSGLTIWDSKTTIHSKNVGLFSHSFRTKMDKPNH